VDTPPLAPVVSVYLQDTNPLDFETYTDLMDDDEARADAAAWFEADETRLDPDPQQALQATRGDRHALAPRLAYTVLAGDQVDDRWRRAEFPDRAIGLHDRVGGAVSILQPPYFTYATGVLGLDGTPTPWMWEHALGTWLDHRQVLSDAERTTYFRDTVGLRIIQTTDNARVYSSGEYVTPERDAALLADVDEQFDMPGVITSQAALDQYRGHDTVEVDALTGATAYYGNLLGSNALETTTVGVVIGCPHYGDAFVERWAAYACEGTGRKGDGGGMALSYTGRGDDVFRHVREDSVLQALLRFARTDTRAYVIVYTAAIPEWVPVAARGEVVRTWSDGLRDVVSALRHLHDCGTPATSTAITGHEAVSIGGKQVRDHLRKLRDRDLVTDEPHPLDGSKRIWVPTGLDGLKPYGDVALDTN